MDRVVITDKMPEDRLKEGELVINFSNQRTDFIAQVTDIDRESKTLDGYSDVTYKYRVLFGYYPVLYPTASGYSPMIRFSYNLFHKPDDQMLHDQKRIVNWIFTRKN